MADLRNTIANSVRLSQSKQTQPVSCTPTTDGNSIQPVVTRLFFPAGQFQLFDVPVKIPGNGTKKIIITSFAELEGGIGTGPPVADVIEGLWLSLQPLGIEPTPSNVRWQNFGNEAWIPLWSANSAGDPAEIEGTMIEFVNPITQLYLHMSTNDQSNVTFQIAIAPADDIVKITWKSQSQ
jgi:hypothetical protein